MKDFLSLARQFISSLGQSFRNRKRRSSDPEKWIEEFRLLSARGHSLGWRFNRYEAHQR